MTSFISTYSINLNNLKLKFKEVEDWSDLVYENGGSFNREGQFIVFDCDGLEVVVNFELNVSARVSHDPGDYWTAPYTDVEVEDFQITIDSVEIDEFEVTLNNETIKLLEKVVKKNI